MQAITAIDEDTFTTLGMIDSDCEYDENNNHTDAAKMMMTSMTMAMMMVGMVMIVTVRMTTTI